MIALIESSIEKSGYRYQKFDEDERTVFKLGFALENGRVDSFIDVDTKRSIVLINVFCPVNVPPVKRSSVAEFITRVNADLILGNFTLNYDDGGVRYKTSFPFESVVDEHEFMFTSNLHFSLTMMDRYLPGFMAMIYGRINPIDAISEIENASYASRN